jgi:hypothetical protein
MPQKMPYRTGRLTASFGWSQGATGKSGGTWNPEWQFGRSSSKCLHLLRRLSRIGAVPPSSPLYNAQVRCCTCQLWKSLSLGSVLKAEGDTCILTGACRQMGS